MNYNVTAYVLFLALMVFIIVYVGRYFYRHGRIFIVSLLRGDVPMADSINRLLLAGYYLLNIGYAFLKLKYWQKIHGLQELFSSLAMNAAMIILVLACLHYFNMLAIYYFSKSNSKTHKYFNHE